MCDKIKAMLSIEESLKRLDEATKGTAQKEYADQLLHVFVCKHHRDWNENTTGDEIAEALVDFLWDTDQECRRCSECGSLMRAGYCVDGGDAYYCSDECLHKHYTEKEWEEMYDGGNSDSYYTEWY